MAKMNWQAAKDRDRVRGNGRDYDRNPSTDNGRVYLADGTSRKVNALIDLDTLIKTCANCGERKNGHHYTTWPGRERQICATCVHALGLPVAAPPPGPDGRRPRLPRRRSLPYSTALPAPRVRRKYGTGPTVQVREITFTRPGRCSICSRTIEAGERASWDWGLKTATCRPCAAKN